MGKCYRCKKSVNEDDDTYGVTEMVVVWGKDFNPNNVNTGRQLLCFDCANAHLKWITNGVEELVTVSIVQEN